MSARYFDKIDEDEKEAERLNPTLKKSFFGRVRGFMRVIV
jgi:hypothetical protein